MPGLMQGPDDRLPHAPSAEDDGFMLVTMVFQTLYSSLIFIGWGGWGRKRSPASGSPATSRSSSSPSLRCSSVGVTTLVSHAAGQKDHDRALLVFNQSQVLSVVVGVVFLVVGMMVRIPYVDALGADARTATMASDYLLWYIPAMALQFAMVAMGAALRGTGNFKPGMIVSTASVILNMVLAPVPDLRMGDPSSRLASPARPCPRSSSVAIASVWLTLYFLPADSYLRFVPR